MGQYNDILNFFPSTSCSLFPPHSSTSGMQGRVWSQCPRTRHDAMDGHALHLFRRRARPKCHGGYNFMPVHFFHIHSKGGSSQQKQKHKNAPLNAAPTKDNRTRAMHRRLIAMLVTCNMLMGIITSLGYRCDTSPLPFFL